MAVGRNRHGRWARKRSTLTAAMRTLALAIALLLLLLWRRAYRLAAAWPSCCLCCSVRRFCHSDVSQLRARTNVCAPRRHANGMKCERPPHLLSFRSPYPSLHAEIRRQSALPVYRGSVSRSLRGRCQRRIQSRGISGSVRLPGQASCARSARARSHMVLFDAPMGDWECGRSRARRIAGSTRGISRGTARAGSMPRCSDCDLIHVMAGSSRAGRRLRRS